MSIREEGKIMKDMFDLNVKSVTLHTVDKQISKNAVGGLGGVNPCIEPPSFGKIEPSTRHTNPGCTLKTMICPTIHRR